MENKKMKDKVKGIIPAIALKLGEKSANQACVWWFNQPKVPEALKKEDN